MTSHALHRHLLHQPFFPLVSPPSPPFHSAAHPPSLPPQPSHYQPNYPFSSSSATPANAYPFFPSDTYSPPPPSPPPAASLPSFPANISSLVFPNSSSGDTHISTRLIATIVSISVSALLSILLLALILHRRKRHNGVLLDVYFLWVVRECEEPKLPHNFVAATSGKGLLVKWCSQLEVLASEAVGCFLTHCGWNSTVEALSLGVPMVAMPQWTDQPTNAKFVEDVWQVGKRVKVDEKGLVGREEIGLCITQVMKSTDLKENGLKWRKMAKDAVCEGGSSDKNIDEFISKLPPLVS
uniref:UDP-glycosyltransferases domain-containing protein n=1 Tax=Kalanchoe fedtschenkoi TaxID=63787 RepID=A0A7N0VH82_KALFE